MSVRRIRFSVLAGLFLAACSSSPSDAPKPARAASVSTDASVAHRDLRSGLPTFAWISRSGLPSFIDAREAALAVKGRVARAFELHDSALATISDLDIDEGARGPVVARFNQRIGDIEVFRGGVSIAMTRDYAPIAASGVLAPTTDGSDKGFLVDPSVVVSTAIAAASRQPSSGAMRAIAAANGYDRFEAPGLARPARVKRVFFPTREGVEPAYYVEVALYGGPAKSFVLSATDGHVLLANDLVRYDAFTYRVYADADTKIPLDGPEGNAFTPHPTATPDGKKLTYVPSQLVTLANYPFSKNDPWLAPGATITSGNNVSAYADLAAPTGFDPATDVQPTTTSASTFDYLYDTGASPNVSRTSESASVTQLFYVTNFLHDWFYDSGFDEKSGNHQLDNFGRGGKGGDPLRAEAQDNSGRNNANAQVPADGESPVIQMYVFSGPSNAKLVVDAPAAIAGEKSVGIASGFGKDIFDVSGAVVLGQDGQAPDVADGCEALGPEVAGKIVLVHRGTCSFAQKAQNAQAVGAIGCIVANVAASVQPTTAPFMGGTATGIDIPVLSLSLADGQALEAAISAGASVTMHRSVGGDLDGALDGSIVAHEWGHVLSGRLIGNGSGLTTNQAGGLGEGWGDFTSLLLIARADDPLGPSGPFGGTYANGVYATSGSGDDIYFGTRRVPYSVDFTKNALTFKHIMNGVALPTGVPTSFGEDGGSNSEVHNTGEIWATMLWECYVALLRDSRRTFAEAQETMKRYLVASLKLTPPDPTLLEARDAVLAAAYAADAKDFELFWQAFARRGAGAGATGPAKDSPTNGPVAESYFAGNYVQVSDAKLLDDVISCDHDGILDDGEVGTVKVTLRNAGSGTLTDTVARATSKTPGVVFEPGQDIKIAPLKPFESTQLELRARIHGPKPLDPIELDVALLDPSFEAGRTISTKVTTRFDADEAPGSSTIDHVDTTKTAWKSTGDSTMGLGKKWSRVTEGDETFWAIPNAMDASDYMLTSPKFTIDAPTFSLSFRHRYSFRTSPRRGTDVDGGVVEISVDAGKTWEDISKYGAVDYNSTLDTGGRGDNVLKGRKAYGNTSKGYPAAWITSKIDVTLPSTPESVQVRFRVGTSTGFRAADGWAVDDIALTGISSTPFYAFVPQEDACDPDAPTANAGDSKNATPHTHVTLQGSATSPKNLPLNFVWTQVEGPSVKLEGDTTPTLAFEAPDAPPGTKLGFVLRANDGALLSPASRADVTLDPVASGSLEGGACGCKSVPVRTNAPVLAAAIAALGVLVRRRGRRAGV